MRGSKAKALRRQAIERYQAMEDPKSGIAVKQYTSITKTAYVDKDEKMHIVTRPSRLRLKDKIGRFLYRRLKKILGEWHPQTFVHFGYRRIYKDLKKEYRRNLKNVAISPKRK